MSKHYPFLVFVIIFVVTNVLIQMNRPKGLEDHHQYLDICPSVTVNHDTYIEGVGTLEYVDQDGTGIEGATMTSYKTKEYDAGLYAVRGITTIDVLGNWTASISLKSGHKYTLVYFKPGEFGPDIVRITVPETEP